MPKRFVFSVAFMLAASATSAASSMDALSALRVWSQHCHVQTPAYPKACKAFEKHAPLTEPGANHFLHTFWHPTHPTPVRLTGYYTPLYLASYHRTKHYDSPLYVPPSSHLFCSREQINNFDDCSQHDPILAWVNRTDRFFLQIQGSALLQFRNEHMRQVVYAGKNGFPYFAIGRWMLKKHKLSVPVSMQSIRAYLKKHPDEVDTILNKNPSFIYMKWQFPIRITGASGFELFPRHSIAVDPEEIPYGSLIELSGVPGPRPHLLTVADDKGSAIRAGHFDLYLGQSKEAEELAGHLNHIVSSVIWVPKH